jgi:hypothetical protein
MSEKEGDAITCMENPTQSKISAYATLKEWYVELYVNPNGTLDIYTMHDDGSRILLSSVSQDDPHFHRFRLTTPKLEND